MFHQIIGGYTLTNILAKIVERAIASVLVPYFDRVESFGRDQWAFRKKHSCRDLVALLICRWLLAIDTGCNIGIYLSDISGVCDCFDWEILAEDLWQNGISDSMLLFLYSYLAPREAAVVVQGHNSDVFTIQDVRARSFPLLSPFLSIFHRSV